MAAHDDDGRSGLQVVQGEAGDGDSGRTRRTSKRAPTSKRPTTAVWVAEVAPHGRDVDWLAAYYRVGIQDQRVLNAVKAYTVMFSQRWAVVYLGALADFAYGVPARTAKPWMLKKTRESLVRLQELRLVETRPPRRGRPRAHELEQQSGADYWIAIPADVSERAAELGCGTPRPRPGMTPSSEPIPSENDPGSSLKSTPTQSEIGPSSGGPIGSSRLSPVPCAVDESVTTSHGGGPNGAAAGAAAGKGDEEQWLTPEQEAHVARVAALIADAVGKTPSALVRFYIGDCLRNGVDADTIEAAVAERLALGHHPRGATGWQPVLKRLHPTSTTDMDTDS